MAHASREPAGNRLSRILIVDDQPIVQYGLAQLIEQEPDLEVCGFASAAPEALEQVSRGSVDVAIVEIAIRNGVGLDLIKQIASVASGVGVLAWSAEDEQLFAERALRSGARGYVDKRCPVAMLLQAIRQVAAGRHYLSQEMTERLLTLAVAGRAGDGAILGTAGQLSDRELEVFELIGHGRTTREIADVLHLSPKTVDRHRENIKAKLDVHTSQELVLRAVRWVVERA